MSDFLTVQQVADRLEVSRRTAHDLLVTGQLCKFVRVGRRIRVRLEVLDEWAEQQEKASRAAATGVIVKDED